MKIKKLLIAIIVINLIIIIIIGVGGFKYVLNVGEAQIIAVDINHETQTKTLELKKDDFVDVIKYIPDVAVELRYATNNNIAKKVLYENKNVYLRKGTADKLKEANNQLKRYGYRIKIWDAYRPTYVQKILWSKVSDSRYIANPKGGSVHNRGAAVDITLVDKNGKEIAMPTDFDGFTKFADKDYKDVEKKCADNAKLLESIMEECGFESVYYEWWHFNDRDWRAYPVVDKVVESSVNTASYDIEKSNEQSVGEVSINSEPDLMEKFRVGINNINMEELKVEFEYEIAKLKNIFSDYSTNE